MSQSSPTFFLETLQAVCKDLGTPETTNAGLLTRVMGDIFRRNPQTGSYQGADSPPSDIVRLYFQVLQQNEKLPTEAQLSLQDISMVHDTLTKTLSEGENLKPLVERLFGVVQTKIEAGLITQAWLMLQIFDYDRSVRIWNERNLYLEEMTIRFNPPEGREPVPASSPHISSSPPSADPFHEALGPLLDRALAMDVHLHALGSDLAEQETWDGIFGGDQAGANLLRSELVTQKWRRPGTDHFETGMDLCRSTLSGEALRHSIGHLVKTGYFLLLIGTPTGWETFIPRLYGWFMECTDGLSVTLFSEIHRRLTMEECTLGEAIDGAYERYLETPFEAMVQALDPTVVQEALETFVAENERESFEDIAKGDYSLTGILLDRALGLPYPNPKLAWLVHRLL